MEILTLLPENDTLLTQRLPDWKPIPGIDQTPGLKIIAANMHFTRERHKAIGLAANQVGIGIRMFVMGTGFAKFTCINPEIISESNVVAFEKEGCLSFPDLQLKVGRPTVIQVRYLDHDLKQVECEFMGIFARCFQHELDHLNGVSFTDKISKLRLDMALKSREKNRLV